MFYNTITKTLFTVKSGEILTMQNHLFYNKEAKNSKFTLQNRLTRVISIKKKIEKKLETKYRLTEQRIAQITLTRFKCLIEADRLNLILHPIKTTTQEILELQQSLKNCEDDYKTIEWKKNRIKKLELSQSDELEKLGIPSALYLPTQTTLGLFQ